MARKHQGPAFSEWRSFAGPEQFDGRKKEPWNTISASGQRDSQYALVATQVVFPMDVLWKSKYTDTLTDALKQFYDPDRGWCGADTN